MKSDMQNTRIWLKGLALECPLGKPTPDCPLNGVRCLPALQLNQTVNGLSDKSIEAIADYHHECYAHRIKGNGTAALLNRELS